MSLNWREIELILKEKDITGSKIQSVVQNSFHSLTWELYSPEDGRFSYYTEVGTECSRLHVLSSDIRYAKTKKLQRFVQFARKNIEGSVITSVVQAPFDRCVIWSLDNHGTKLKIFIRLYSGPGANIIVTDENLKILDLLLRRPGRDEISGEVLTVTERTSETKPFEIREHSGSFNKFIEDFYNGKQNSDTLESLRKQVEARKEHELSRLASSINSSQRTLEENSEYLKTKKTADLLASNTHLFKQGDGFADVTDWESNSIITIKLNKSLSPGDNVQAYYDKYQRELGTYKNAQQELEHLKEEYRKTEERFNRALSVSDNPTEDIASLKKILESTASPVQEHNGPGIRCTSGGFEILAGRNAKENDELLRHYAKGNDMWIHTRDFPGGYVFIKFRRDKTIPLDVLLDGANLAVLFSKGKDLAKVDLYYTQVRYLRRAKDGKTGLVLPTQEKNLTITPDRNRIKRLIPNQRAITD